MRVAFLVMLVTYVVAPGAAAWAQRPVLPADTSSPGDTVVVALSPIEVLVSLAAEARGPGVGSGVGRFVTLPGAGGSTFGMLFDVLEDLPSVSTYDDLGSPFKRTLVLRGFTASPVVGLPQGVTVFIDGVPVNEPGAGEVNFDLLPLDYLERVEVLSGTATLLGPNSLGGAVNLVTRRGGAGAGGEIEVAGGSYESLTARASGGGRVGEWDWYAGADHDRIDGWRELMRSERTSGYATVGRFGRASGIRFQTVAAHSYAQTAGSLPLSVYLARPDSNLTAGDFEDLWQVHLAASAYAEVEDGIGSARLFVRAGGAERFNVNQENDPDVRGFTDTRTVGADADWRRVFVWGSGTLGLRAGAGAVLNWTDIEIHAERIEPGLTTEVNSPIRRFDGYLLADYEIGVASLSLGLRYDRVRIPFNNRLNPSRDTVSTFPQWNPRAGLSVRVAPGATLYASVGRGFRAPALIELACADPAEPCPLPFALGDDPPLAPVLATTYEAGASWTRGRGTITASAYRTDIRDDIFLFPYAEENEPEGSTIDGYFANLPRTRRVGAEVRGVFQPLDVLRLDAAYAYTLPTFQTDDLEIFSIREAAGGKNEVEKGDRLPLVPNHTLSLGAALSAARGLTAGATVRYVGERVLRGDEANEEPPLDAYWVTDARFAYARSEWTLEAVVSNVFNNDYFAFGTFNINQGAGGTLERFVTPAAPRRFEVTLRRTFRR